MSIKSITSFFLAACALIVPMANATEGYDFYEISADCSTSALPAPASATQEYRIMNGVTLTVDSAQYTSAAPIHAFGDENGDAVVTLQFTASGSTEANSALTTISAHHFWAGGQSVTPDWHTTIQITLDAAGVAALQQAMSEGGDYEQKLVIAMDDNSSDSKGYVNECTYDWGKYALTGNLGWTIVGDGFIIDAKDCHLEDGQIALVGYDKKTRGQYDDYTSYSSLAIVAKGKPTVTPEPATATLSLLALGALCARRRRTA